MGAAEREFDRPLKVALQHAVGQGALAFPCEGRTLERWRSLAKIASQDLALVKLYEAHWDAAAVLHEIESSSLPEESLWGVWCAEPPSARVEARCVGDQIELTGTKAWCSGASLLTHALVSAWNENGNPVLAAVHLREPRVRVTERGWKAVGMSGTQSVEVIFDRAPARLIGAPGSYTGRPGFWAGGAGIAACWYGAARAIGEFVARACSSGTPDAHRLAHLGAIDVALASSAAILRDAAHAFDAGAVDAKELALRVRTVVERDCKEVIDRAGRALGAAPLCQDEWFARVIADLPVFLRQSHAERDLASLGESVAGGTRQAWKL